MEQLIVFLIMLQLKHFYLDFAAQTESELKYKGVYSDFRGMTHSIKHGVGSLLCTMFVLDLTLQYFALAVIVGFIDFLFHYHIDFIKTKFGPTDVTKKDFWMWFGADQLGHQLTYVLLVLTVF